METKAWTHPTTGEIRQYINGEDVYELTGGVTPGYGHRYSGADYDRIVSAKYWLDAEGGLHIDRLVQRGKVDAKELRELIEKALATTQETV